MPAVSFSWVSQRLCLIRPGCGASSWVKVQVKGSRILRFAVAVASAGLPDDSFWHLLSLALTQILQQSKAMFCQIRSSFPSNKTVFSHKRRINCKQQREVPVR